MKRRENGSPGVGRQIANWVLTKTLNWAMTFKQRQGGERAGVGLEIVSWCKEPKAKGGVTVKSQRTGGAL